ncbi:MAG: hypothetical protein A3E18_02355 [Candidatus Nealsonbacteria bacterium RIFCSPHIGHO2_12_FULL_38_18]|nr:MAG: hypothetical protein US88_C0026G0002 [Parcubacteria group bacterium GW2011_GWA2_38_27]OGZ23629.1 MAG: hypothetical protein A3E18_02355 [Candidatus Nealsonbacteria bacterium RIFCSPHIGHO2_12_FULL_38_18]
MAEKDKIKIELQKTKKDLEDLEAYIEEFSAFLPLAVCAVNPIGIIININKAMEGLINCSSLEIVGESLSAVFLDANKAEEIKKEIADKNFIYGKELIVLTKDKREISVSVSVSARKDKEGNYIGYFVALTVIAELKKLQEELEEKVEERTGELKERVEELEKFHDLTVDRELKIIELKNKIKELEGQASKNLQD